MEKWKKIIGWLTECKFDKIWKGKDFNDFRYFLRSQAVPSGGFVVTFPLTEGGFVRFFYKIKEVREDRLVFDGVPELVVPNDGSSQGVPDRCKDYPVWRVNEETVA